jgi:hypothetical protein
MHRLSLLAGTIFFTVIGVLGFLPSRSEGIEADFKVGIEKVYLALSGCNHLVDIYIAGGVAEISSFNLKIFFNSEALTFYGTAENDLIVIPGAYEWEKLSYRIGEEVTIIGRTPYRTLEINGFANTENGDHEPVSYTLPEGTSLARLKFQIAYDPDYECQFVPIEFIWTDCRDNSFVMNDSVQTIAVSNQIFDPYGNEITYTDGEFPSMTGAPDECLAAGDLQRIADFQNGGVDIACFGKDRFIYHRGDVNLDGHYSNMADLVVFTNYFVYGLAAFQYNIEGQIAETEINADGYVLTVADWYCLRRIISGYRQPCDW